MKLKFRDNTFFQIEEASSALKNIKSLVLYKPHIGLTEQTINP